MKKFLIILFFSLCAYQAYQEIHFIYSVDLENPGDDFHDDSCVITGSESDLYEVIN